MTALSTREALIRTMARTRVTADRGDLIAGAELGEWIEFLADHLIASGAVVDAATLADEMTAWADEIEPDHQWLNFPVTPDEIRAKRDRWLPGGLGGAG